MSSWSIRSGRSYLDTDQGAKDTPQICRMGWCMDYADANNWDKEVMAIGWLAESD